MLPFLKNLFRRKRPDHIHWYKAHTFEEQAGYHKACVKEWRCGCGASCNSEDRNKYADFVCSLRLSPEEKLRFCP